VQLSAFVDVMGSTAGPTVASFLFVVTLAKHEALLRDSSADKAALAQHLADIMENVRLKILSRCNLGALDAMPNGDEMMDDDKLGDDVNTVQKAIPLPDGIVSCR